jgi:hypothetical protein
MATILNGRLPDSLLAEVPWAPGEYIAADALPSLTRLNAAFRARFGRDLTINEGYRSYATQVEYKARTKLPKTDPRYLRFASTPGKSVHGWGYAVDFGLIYGFGSDEYAWLADHAPDFGWWQPPQYRADGDYPEFWHWERNPSLEQPTEPAAAAPARVPEEDDDMFQLIEKLYREELGREPDPSGIATWLDVARAQGAVAMVEAFRKSKAERATVLRAFRVLLNRTPSERDIAERAGKQTVAEVWASIKASGEYQDKH